MLNLRKTITSLAILVTFVMSALNRTSDLRCFGMTAREKHYVGTLTDVGNDGVKRLQILRRDVRERSIGRRDLSIRYRRVVNDPTVNRLPGGVLQLVPKTRVASVPLGGIRGDDHHVDWNPRNLSHGSSVVFEP